MFGIRTTLRIGSIVFGLSALLLLLVPEFFLALLALPTDDLALSWSMRMIGITLVALAGNMWANSNQSDDLRVRTVGVIMAFSASALGLLTFLVPAPLTWFSGVYAMVGFAFGVNYSICVLREKY